MERRKICMYCETWSSGGIESYLLQILRRVERDRFAVCLAVARKDESVFDGELARLGVEPLVLCSGSRRGALGRTLGSVVPFYRLCRRERFDAVHLNVFHGAALLLAAAARAAGVERVIVHCHGAGLRKSPGRPLKLAVHRLCAGLLGWTATERWAPSRAAAEFLFPGKADVRMMENGIDTQRFRFDGTVRWEERQRLGLGDRLVIGCVGRLEDQKNQTFLLDVLALLVPRRDAALLLVGDGEDRQALQEKARRLGLADRTILYGRSEHVERLLWALDAIAVPSLREGLSIAAIEGQAAGVPVLCSPGVPEEARVTEALTFLPAGDAAAWADCLEQLAPTDRLALNDRVAAGACNVDSSARKVLEAYGQPQSEGKGP